MLNHQFRIGFADECSVERVKNLLRKRFYAVIRHLIPITNFPLAFSENQCYVREFRNCLSTILHEPDKQINNWLKQNRRYLAGIENLRNFRQPNSKLVSHLNSFSCPQKGNFIDLCNRDSRSRLLVSYHFGDFIYGNNILAGFEPNTRQQSFLTQLHSSSNFLHNMHTCFGVNEFSKRKQLTLDTASSADLLALLRNSNQTVLSFVDLPFGFGERVAVSFFGRQAWFPKGPATLSLVSRSPIVPVINVWDGVRNNIQLRPQIEPRLNPQESFHDGVVRITQSLVSVLEDLVARYPWQWRFLSALPSYYLEQEVNLNV